MTIGWREKQARCAEGLDERRSVELALQNMDALGLTGGTIYIDGKLCAFTIGERLHPQMQLIHIEKGDTEYDGIFPIINQQYVLQNVRMWNWLTEKRTWALKGCVRQNVPITL